MLTAGPKRAAQLASVRSRPEAIPVNLPLIALVFGIILIAELPDKTMFASLMLGTRFAPRLVFVGAAAAFLIHVILAVAAGGLLSLLPRPVLDYVIAGLFSVGAAMMFQASRSSEEEEEAALEQAADAAAWKAIASSFLVILLGEWGDITQIATANLAAKYNDPIAVGIGAPLGLCTASERRPSPASPSTRRSEPRAEPLCSPPPATISAGRPVTVPLR
jgi:putative Ca2+/H+ antiporter (TMEM165/GDT1 family)